MQAECDQYRTILAETVRHEGWGLWLSFWLGIPGASRKELFGPAGQRQVVVWKSPLALLKRTLGSGAASVGLWAKALPQSGPHFIG